MARVLQHVGEFHPSELELTAAAGRGAMTAAAPAALA
jgi:hypothetical protein